MPAVNLGCGAQGRNVVWHAQDLVNPHILLLGSSGVGKSYQIRNWCKQLVATGVRRIHVFDAHGDLDLQNASDVSFSQSSGYGLNPLTVSPDPDYGGPRRRINFVVSMLGAAGRKLGPKQEAVLRTLLTDIYAANGFYEDRPGTWAIPEGSSKRKQPSFIDVTRFGRAKLTSLYTGANSRAVAALEAVNREATRMVSAARKAGSEPTTEAKEALERLKTKATSTYADYVSTITTGRELQEVLKYNSRDVLASVIERLENLHASGVFSPNPGPFRPGTPVWRYDLRTLQEETKRLFVNFRLQQLLERARQRGMVSEVVEYAVVDEAHMLASADDPEHPLNCIAREARKFGLGLLCASQSAEHFSIDFMANMATKVLLGLDTVYWPDAQRRLRVDATQLGAIRAKRSCLVQMRTAGAASSGFQLVTMP